METICIQLHISVLQLWHGTTDCFKTMSRRVTETKDRMDIRNILDKVRLDTGIWQDIYITLLSKFEKLFGFV